MTSMWAQCEVRAKCETSDDCIVNKFFVSVFKLSGFFERYNFYFLTRLFINNPHHKLDNLLMSFSYLNRKMWASAFFFFFLTEKTGMKPARSQIPKFHEPGPSMRESRQKSHCHKILNLNMVTKHNLAFALNIQNTRIHRSLPVNTDFFLLSLGAEDRVPSISPYLTLTLDIFLST